MSYYDIIDIDKDGNPITKEYRNIIEYEIELWISDNAATIYDEETIKYILSIRQEIIDGLIFDNSEIELQKTEIINGIEETYIIPAIQTLVENNIVTFFPIPKIIKGFKPFKYKGNKKKNSGGRKTGRSQQTRQRYNWVRDKYYNFVDKRLAGRLEDIAGLIRSELLEKPPKFWIGTHYKKSTILKILKNKLWEEK